MPSEKVKINPLSELESYLDSEEVGAESYLFQRSIDYAEQSKEEAGKLERLSDIRKLFSSLSEKERTILERKLGGHTREEIAKDLKCSTKTVDRIWKKFKKRAELMT